MRIRFQRMAVTSSLLCAAPLAAQQTGAMGKDAMAMAPLGRDFSLERGPDVYVVLRPSERVPAQGALYLGKLTRFSGEQSFALPDGTDLGDYSSRVLWCKKYSVPMGTAALVSAA